MSSNNTEPQGTSPFREEKGVETESAGFQVVAFDHLSRYIIKHECFECKEKAKRGLQLGYYDFCNFHLHCNQESFVSGMFLSSRSMLCWLITITARIITVSLDRKGYNNTNKARTTDGRCKNTQRWNHLRLFHFNGCSRLRLKPPFPSISRMFLLTVPRRI